MQTVLSILGFAALAAAPAVWAHWRAPRYGKTLTPITDGCVRPIEFRPGPPPLPEIDVGPGLRRPAPA